MASLRAKSQSKEDSARVASEFAKISIRGMEVASKEGAPPLEEGFIPDKRLPEVDVLLVNGNKI